MPLSSVVGAQSIIKPGVCTSSTRPAVPFEGQMIYETDTDRTLVYNATAWVIPNSPAQNPQGLELITTTTCTVGGSASNGVVTVGSAVTTFSVDNCFSSSYNVYKVIMNGGTNSANCDYQIQLLGITTAIYSINLVYMTNGSSAVNGHNQTAVDAWNYVGGGTPQNTHMSCEIFSPNAAKVKTIIAPYFFPTSGGGVGYYQGGGICDSTTQATGMKIRVSSGTTTGSTLRVYGYRNS